MKAGGRIALFDEPTLSKPLLTQRNNSFLCVKCAYSTDGFQRQFLNLTAVVLQVFFKSHIDISRNVLKEREWLAE